MIDDPAEADTREVILRNLRAVYGGELPEWLPESAADAYVAHVTAFIDTMPPLSADQRRRIGALLRPSATAATAVSGCA